MTIATRRTLLIPYTEAFESDFLVLNYCAKNRALMNGPTTVAAAKQLFQRVLHDSSLYAMAVLDNYNREYMGHVFIEFESEGRAELGFLFDKAYWGQGFASEALNAFSPICVSVLVYSVWSQLLKRNMKLRVLFCKSSVLSTPWMWMNFMAHVANLSGRLKRIGLAHPVRWQSKTYRSKSSHF